MSEAQHAHFHLGQKLEQHPFVAGDGAVLEMFRNDLPNTVLIGLSNMTEDEQAMLTQSAGEFGVFRNEGGACLVVLKLGDLAFDIQFNGAAIPEEYLQSEEAIQSALRLNMMALDSQNGELKVIREFALPEAICHTLVEVLKTQRTTQDAMGVNVENMHLLNTMSTEQVLEAITLQPLQSVIAPSCNCGGHHHHHH